MNTEVYKSENVRIAKKVFMYVCTAAKSAGTLNSMEQDGFVPIR